MNRFWLRLAIKLAVVLAVAVGGVILAFLRSPRFSGQTKAMTVAAFLLALYLGFVVYPDEKAFREARREGRADPWAYVNFKNGHARSRHLGQIDELLWKASYGEKGDWALYLYDHYFYDGRHGGEVKQRLLRKKQRELDAIRATPDVKKARNFLADYKFDPEAAEAREILFTALERSGAGTKESPPPALLHKLARMSAGNRILYSVTVADDGECPGLAGAALPVSKRLEEAMQAFALTAQPAPDGGSIRARIGCVARKGATYGDTPARAELIAVSLQVYPPGAETQAWLGAVAAQSPRTVSGLRKDDAAYSQRAVTAATTGELAKSLQSAFRYWD